MARQVQRDVRQSNPAAMLRAESGSRVGPLIAQTGPSDNINLTQRGSSVISSGGGGRTVPDAIRARRGASPITQPIKLNQDGMPSTSADQSQTPPAMSRAVDLAEKMAARTDDQLLAIMDAAARGVGFGKLKPEAVAVLGPYAEAEARKRGIYPPKKDSTISTSSSGNGMTVVTSPASAESSKPPDSGVSPDQTTTASQTQAAEEASGAKIIRFPANGGGGGVSVGPIGPGTMPYSGGSGAGPAEAGARIQPQMLVEKKPDAGGMPAWGWLLLLAAGVTAVVVWNKQGKMNGLPLMADVDEA